MGPRALAALLCVVALPALASPVAGAPPPIVDTQKSPASTAIDVRALERLPTGRSVREILLVLPSSVGGQPVASAELGVGAICKTVQPSSLPPGWRCNDAGKGGVNLSGPPLKPGQSIWVEFAPPITHKLTVPIGGALYDLDQKVLWKEKIPLGQLQPPQLQTEPKRAIRLPQRMSPGDRIQFKPLDPKFTPGGGEWKIGGLSPKWNGSFDRPVYDLELPPDFGRGLTPPIKISYVDPWKTTLVDGPATDVVISPSPHPAGDRPRAGGCSPQVISGSTFCVCGEFPPDAAAALLINDRPVGEYLVSSSPTILNYSLPGDFPVGELRLSGGKSSSFEIADGARGVLIRVNGEIDRDKLMRGESTSLKLWLEGTQEPVSLRLWNSTPAIVSLEGGEDQVVTTAGGATNDVTRAVHAGTVGDFSLHFELSVGTCPCANDGGRNDVLKPDGTQVDEPPRPPASR